MKPFIALLMALFLHTSSQAAIISTDLATQGDALLTRDTLTGLEWLDVTATQGQSVDAVLAGFGDYTGSYGFRHATRDEMETLWSNFGLIVQYSASDQVQRDLAANFVATLGETQANNRHTITYGFYDLQLNGNWRVSQVHAGINSADAYTNYSVTAQPTDTSLAGVGHYLVRESTASVSVPGTGVILLGGMGLLGITQRRKQGACA